MLTGAVHSGLSPAYSCRVPVSIITSPLPMDTDQYRLKAFNVEHGLHDVTIEVREVGDEYLLSCKLPVSGELLTGQADDCFAALQALRRKAEGQNWMICCKGARRNVWPSAMSRQMGGGVKAYVLEMGRQGRVDSMVEIFDEDTPESYSTVTDQEAYAHAWFKSLR
jgi:hypothetical protein